jgi:ATP-dependent DNA ligase
MDRLRVRHGTWRIDVAVASRGARQAYLDDELRACAQTFSHDMIQPASASGNAAALVFFVLDLLHLDGNDFGARRKARLADCCRMRAHLSRTAITRPGHARTFHERKPAMLLEGIVSKRARGGLCTGQ